MMPEDTQDLTFGQRAADAVARFGGSWRFIGLFSLALAIWITANTISDHPIDAFPYILLNLCLSCLAAVQAPIIMMSQNRQGERDRAHAEADYANNRRMRLELLAAHVKLDALLEQSGLSASDLLASETLDAERIGALLAHYRSAPQRGALGQGPVSTKHEATSGAVGPRTPVTLPDPRPPTPRATERSEHE